MSVTAQGSALEAFAKLAGLNLGEQLRVLEGICSVHPDGGWLNRRYVVPCGGEILDARALAGLFLFGERIVWICSIAKEAKASFRRIAHLIESSPELRQNMAKIRRANGEESIELHNGARLLFPGRPQSARGLSADMVLIDGLLRREDEVHLIPVLSCARNPQRVQRI